jgi:hypothetical protein
VNATNCLFLRSILCLSCAGLAIGCSTYEEYTRREKVAVVMEIDSVPQGAEVYISRSPSSLPPGEPGGEWIARGGFSFRGRTPLQEQDEIVASTKGVRKVLPGGAILYETTGVAVYQENARRIVLITPGFRTVDVTERIGSEPRLRFKLERLEGKDGSAEPEAKGPRVLPGAQGRLSIVSVPSPADLEIDGHYVGETPANLQLPAGNHKLLLKRPGYTEWRREIETFPGSDQKVSATLETEQEGRAAGRGKSP